MRNQSKYNEKTRALNPIEEQILHEVEQKSGMKIPATNVKYERHTPRATVCTVFLTIFAEHGDDPNLRAITGVTIRSKKDKENPVTGREQSFRRALEDYVE